MVKKVFISVGMSGRYECDVSQDICRAYENVHKLFGECEIVDNWCCDGPEYTGRLWYLGEAIKKLGDCSTVNIQATLRVYLLIARLEEHISIG